MSTVRCIHHFFLLYKKYKWYNMKYRKRGESRDKGTYIRVAGTSRPADAVKIRELEMEGTNVFWDELVCIGYKVEDEAVQKLCFDITEYMRNAMSTEEERKNVQEVTRQQLLNWKVLKKSEGEILATNAFVLLTSNYFRFSKIQCALFKGNDRDIFIDKKEYCGPLYEQIEAAYQFVLRHINLGAEIEGLVRKDVYELPIGAIREMIINAVCHRNFMDNSCVQVAIYDNRVEVTSPGMLFGGLTLEEAINGRSKIRNRAVAEIFSRMELIEEWGTGIRRILKRAEEYELPTPEFMEIGDTFRVNLYKKADKKADKNIERQQAIIQYVKEAGSVSNKEAREILGLAESTTKRILKEMVQDGMLSESGQRKTKRYFLK